MCTRKRTHALMLEQFNNSPAVKLGGSWFAKKKGTEVKFYLKTDQNKFDEITKECFEATMKKSSFFPITEIKQNLKKLMESNNE